MKNFDDEGCQQVLKDYVDAGRVEHSKNPGLPRMINKYVYLKECVKK